MKEQFRTKKFSNENLARLEQITEVIESYQSQGIQLTLRQLYYQLVAADLITNSLKEYSKLSNLLTDARYAGLVDWESIEDRIRKPSLPQTFEDAKELLRAAVHSYKLDLWEDQDNYVELYTEKDALSSILAPIANKYRIPFSVNRGYSSASSMYDAAQRFKEHHDKQCVLLYLGDHDPSGLDMVRDIGARLFEFGAEVNVHHIALTFEQIKQYEPPPNPAKFSDPRAKAYVAEHGRTSWEVDALKPQVMIKLVSKSIEEYIDEDKKDAVLKREKMETEAIEEFADTFEA